MIPGMNVQETNPIKVEAHRSLTHGDFSRKSRMRRGHCPLSGGVQWPACQRSPKVTKGYQARSASFLSCLSLRFFTG